MEYERLISQRGHGNLYQFDRAYVGKGIIDILV